MKLESEPNTLCEPAQLGKKGMLEDRLAEITLGHGGQSHTGDEQPVSVGPGRGLSGGAQCRDVHTCCQLLSTFVTLARGTGSWS